MKPIIAIAFTIIGVMLHIIYLDAKIELYPTVIDHNVVLITIDPDTNVAIDTSIYVLKDTIR